MKSEPLTAMGVVRAKPGREQELGRRMSTLLEPTRAEPGCLAYDLYQSTEDPAVWVVIERWRAVADLEAHILSSHMRTFLAKAGDLVDGSPDNFRLKPAPRDANAVETKL